jgi:hypothetical protein
VSVESQAQTKKVDAMGARLYSRLNWGKRAVMAILLLAWINLNAELGNSWVLVSFDSNKQASDSKSTSSATYTLLGVGITAIVTLISLFIKYLLDAALENRRHGRELRIKEQDHINEIDRLTRQMEETRRGRTLDVKRSVFVQYLTSSQSIYNEIISIRREHRASPNEAEYKRRLKAIDAQPSQIALDEMRLVASGDSTSAAENLWAHLRGDPVPEGLANGSREWAAWKAAYWDRRSLLVGQCRLDLEN